MAIQHLGVTAPISTSDPTPMDCNLTLALECTLKIFGMYDSQERIKQREIALRHLLDITREFVRLVCKRRNIPIREMESAGGAVYTFGSYKLGVNSADADIDTLCIVPNYVWRTDFFQDMLDLLKKNPNVTHITPISESYVPVIKFNYNDIPIDFVCARLNVKSVPSNINLKDSSLLVGLDDRCIRSMNGTRVADEIMRLVPDVNTFRIALRCIKLWAKNKGVYSNVMGFLGGVAWAILVGRVCQLYPNATASVIVHEFFRIFTSWKWPAPVVLKPIEDIYSVSTGALRVWNPTTSAVDRAHRMPVITPTYPSMCATHNVTPSTQRILMGEFHIATKTMEKIMTGRLPWSALFLSHSFFKNYKYYLQVVVTATTPDAYLGWTGLVEAKLRQLVLKLEAVSVIALVHPFVEGFRYSYDCCSPEDVRLATLDQIVLPQRSFHRKKSIKIYKKIFYIGLYIRMKSGQSRTLDLTKPIYEFMNMVKLWPEFNKSQMGISVENVRDIDLPPEVHPKSEALISKRALSKSPSPTLQPIQADININKKVKTHLFSNSPIPINNSQSISMASSV